MGETIREIRNFAQDRRGTTAMVFALSLVPAVAVVGSSLDYASALRSKSQLQAVVDIAAQAGARLPATANQNRVDAAHKSFAVNAATSGFANLVPTVQATNAQVSVSASFNHPTTIMKMFGHDQITVSASTSARSQVENGGVACLIALSETSPDGLHLQGVNKVSSQNCWAWINSNAATSINAVGASSGTGQGFCTYGGVDGAEHFTPAPYTQCERMADPFYDKFKSYNPPNANSCTATNLQLSSGTYTLNPGTYCGNTVFKPKAVVTMNPGVYVFRDGYLQVQAGASLKGDGVSLFFYAQNTRMEVRGGADIDLKAPASGDLAGFVIVDRKLDWYDASIRETVIQGGGRVKIEGIVYAPQWKLNISGNGEVNQESNYFAIVADTVYMEGNGKFYIKSNADAAGLPNHMPKIKNGPVLLN